MLIMEAFFSSDSLKAIFAEWEVLIVGICSVFGGKMESGSVKTGSIAGSFSRNKYVKPSGDEWN